MCRFVFLATAMCLLACAHVTASQAQRSLAEMVADLKKGDADRLRAIAELDSLGTKAAEAAPALVGMFAIKNEDVRLAAAIALGKIGKAAIDPLEKAASADDADVRFYAVWAIAFIGPPVQSATPVVLRALGDTSAQVRRKAAYALGRINANPKLAVGPLVTALADPDTDVVQAVQDALPTMGKAATPLLVKILRSDNPTPRLRAIQTLGAIGADAAEAVPDLQGLLQSGKGLAEPAANALAGIGVPALPALTSAAAADDAAVRAQALGALQRIGAPAVPALVDLLGAKQADVRRQAAALLGPIPVNDKMVIIGLGYALKDDDYQVRRNALQALRNRGAAAKLAEPYVAVLLTDSDPPLRLDAFHTLKNLGVDPRPSLKKALSHADPAIRMNTASLMVALNLEVDLAEPILLDGLKAKDLAARIQAANTLAQRGLQTDAVLPIFIDGLSADTAPVRLICLERLALIGPPAKAAIPGLIKALADTAPRSRLIAARALGNIGPDAKQALDALAMLGKDDDPSVRQVAQAAAVQIRADPKQKEFQVQGVLTASDPFDRVRTQHHHVVHIYPMKAGQQYTIDLTSPWDNYLRLENAQGEQLAQDDDSGGNLNARITFQPPADGWYRVIVTTYAPGATGNYSLRIR
jgi:HEAT repeat protein